MIPIHLKRLDFDSSPVQVPAKKPRRVDDPSKFSFHKLIFDIQAEIFSYLTLPQFLRSVNILTLTTTSQHIVRWLNDHNQTLDDCNFLPENTRKFVLLHGQELKHWTTNFAADFTQMARLSSLLVTGKFCSAQMQSIIESVGSTLITLDLSHVAISYGAVERLNKRRDLSSLEVLKLAAPDYSGGLVRHLETWPLLSNLCELHLFRLSQTDRVFRSINFPNLRTLALRQCEDHKNSKVLSETLNLLDKSSASTALTFLNLKGSIGDKTLAALENPSYLTNLQVLKCNKTFKAFLRLPSLKKLSIESVYLSSLFDNPYYSSLKTFHVKNFYAADTLSILEQNNPYVTALTDLKLALCPPMENVFYSFATSDRASKLRHLCINVSDLATFYQTGRSYRFINLTSLHLKDVRLNDHSLKIFCETNEAPLTYLNLSMNFLTDTVPISECQSLSKLRVLDLSHNKILHSGVAHLRNSTVLHLLERVELAYNSIGTLGAWNLADWKILENYTVLDLRSNNIKDVGLVKIANSPYNRFLQELNLMSNPLGFTGAKALNQSDLIKRLKKLSFSFTTYVGEEMFQTKVSEPDMLDVHLKALTNYKITPVQH